MSFSAFTAFTEEKINNFISATINVFMFLPHFFSIKNLSKTLFAPWKNMVENEKTTSTGVGDAMTRLSFNVISRLVGFGVRSCVITSYFLLQIIIVLLLPIVFTLYIFLLPLRYIVDHSNTAEKREADEKGRKVQFLKSHCLELANQTAVEEWYNTTVAPLSEHLSWYNKIRLLSIPPIGRDWTSGYTPTMDKFCERTVPTSNDVHLIGRNNELTQVEHSLLKNSSANILLVGPEGVGRTAIINALAENIYYGRTSPNLAYKRVLTIDLQSILSQSTDNIVRLNTLGTIFAEAHNAGNVILVIHDLDKYVSNQENHIDCSDILSRHATSNKINIIATSNPQNFQKYIYPNAKIHEIFDKIDLEEVKVDQCVSILLDLVVRFEKKFNLVIPYETVVMTVTKAHQFVTALPLPESAINILNEVCSSAVQNRTQTILPEMINAHLTQKLHIPTQITPELKQKLLTLESELNKHIIQQPNAVANLSDALMNAFVAGARPNKPLASFLFLGPTGVGKTESAKALTKVFFNDNKALIRLDMANYQATPDIIKLLGDANNVGILTQMVRTQPYGVLLLDEIEKANHDLLNIFLSVLDEGYFVDGKGDRIDCKNLIVIATSNAGADFIFEKLVKKEVVTTDSLLNELIAQNIYNPEFLNRFDGVIMFEPLTNSAIYTIAQKLLHDLDTELFASHQVHLNISDQTLAQLIATHYNQQFGARDLKRIIDFEIKNKITSKLLDNSIQKGTTITL